MHGIAVIPAHELLIHRLGVVRHGAIILAGVPDFVQCLRQRNHVGDFVAGVALVDIGQGLVVDVFVYSRRVHHIIVDLLVSPVGPVVGLEGDFHILAVAGEGLGEVACPGCAVPHLCAPEGIEIVEGAGAVFCQPQCLELGQPGVHFGGCFRTRGELEFQLHAVNDNGFAGLADFIAGGQERDGTGGLTHADALGQLPGNAGGQQNAVLVIAAAAHALAGIDVFLHGMLGKAHRGNHGNLAAVQLLLDGQGFIRLVLCVHYTGNAAEMVRMGMGDDDRLHREGAQILFNQLHGCLAALHTHQGVEDNPAGVALDHGEVRHIIAPHLVNARDYFKQTIGMVVFGILPQAGIDAIRRRFIVVQKGVGSLAPQNLSVLIL